MRPSTKLKQTQGTERGSGRHSAIRNPQSAIGGQFRLGLDRDEVPREGQDAALRDGEWAGNRDDEAKQRRSAVQRQAEAERLFARQQAYAADVNLTELALAADDLGRAKDLLDSDRRSVSWSIKLGRKSADKRARRARHWRLPHFLSTGISGF